MYNMGEDKQIEKAALLADTEPAEVLNTERAHSFIRANMNSGKQTERSHRPFFFCASAVLAVAAIAAVAIISRPWVDGLGTPATISEDSYVHASVADVDSILCMQPDSLTVKSEVQK